MVKNGEILYPNMWFNIKFSTWKGDEKYYCISVDNMGYNIMDCSGKLICNIWFDDINQERAPRYNLIGEKDGKQYYIYPDTGIYDIENKVWVVETFNDKTENK